jgi:hypothetical protein
MSGRLSSIVKRVRQEPPRIIVFGLRGVGKTSFAAKAANPIFVPTEDGLGVLDVPAFPLAKTFHDLLDNLKALLTEEHDYKTVVVDSLDWAEKLVHIVVRAKYGETIFTDYGKGYVYCVPYFEELLGLLDQLRTQKGMTVLLIAHTLVKRFQSPDCEPYDRWELDLHQKVASVCEEWADAVLFASQKVFTAETKLAFNQKAVRGIGSGERILLTEERPSHVAKNRYSLPYEMPLDYRAVVTEIVRAWKRPQQGLEEKK